MWPYRLPRDEAEKAQLEAENLRNNVRLQFRQMKASETTEDSGLFNFALCLLILMFLLPFVMQVASIAMVRSIF